MADAMGGGSRLRAWAGRRSVCACGRRPVRPATCRRPCRWIGRGSALRDARASRGRRPRWPPRSSGSGSSTMSGPRAGSRGPEFGDDALDAGAGMRGGSMVTNQLPKPVGVGGDHGRGSVLRGWGIRAGCGSGAGGGAAVPGRARPFVTDVVENQHSRRQPATFVRSSA